MGKKEQWSKNAVSFYSGLCLGLVAECLGDQDLVLENLGEGVVVGAYTLARVSSWIFHNDELRDYARKERTLLFGMSYFLGQTTSNMILDIQG